MLFNSDAFLFGFLPVVLLGFALLAHWRARRAIMLFLVVVSLVFYGWWNWHYLVLLAFSIGFNFVWAEIVRRDPDRRRAKWLVGLGVAVNLGVLGYFKYSDFFLSTLNATLGTEWPLRHIILPLGISFFTFEQITYQVDAYRQQIREHDVLSYCLFATFFPRLIAGPIVRPREILPQLRLPETFVFSSANVSTGLFIFAIGLFKKVMLADQLAPWVDGVFGRADAAAFFDAWGAALAFALQIYFDFSGYTDMAIGLALMVNIRLPENFDSPYRASSIADFWRRWHMTLSTFLRDYLYVPLGGNRRGEIRRLANLLITMLLGGLWHGASWTFVLWGGVHGLYLAINHLWRRTRVLMPLPLAWALTFGAVVVAWVLFRAESLARAEMVLSGMTGLNGFAWDPTPHSIGRHEWKRLAALLALVLLAPNRQAITCWRWSNDYVYAAVFGVLAGLCILRLGNPVPFVYFQF